MDINSQLSFFVETSKSPNNGYMTLIRKLKQARRFRDISQEELAGKLGTTTGTISRWENVKTTPSIYDFCCWANTLQIDLYLDMKRGD
jgi:transcriptional regulator with XRE-family HTH domain